MIADDRLEKFVEADLVRWAEARGGLAIKLKLDADRGFHDRTILLPRGRVAFVETKRPRGGAVSEQQKRWLAKLQALGFCAVVVRNLEELEKLEQELL